MTNPHVHVYPGRNRTGLRAQLDDARRVAHDLRRALNDTDPERCRTLVNDLYDAGATWIIGSRRPLDDDDWLTATELADELHESAYTIRNWGTRNRIRRKKRGDRTVYNVGDINTYRRYLNLKSQGALPGITFDQYQRGS